MLRPAAGDKPSAVAARARPASTTPNPAGMGNRMATRMAKSMVMAWVKPSPNSSVAVMYQNSPINAAQLNSETAPAARKRAGLRRQRSTVWAKLCWSVASQRARRSGSAQLFSWWNKRRPPQKRRATAGKSSKKPVSVVRVGAATGMVNTSCRKMKSAPPIRTAKLTVISNTLSSVTAAMAVAIGTPCR